MAFVVGLAFLSVVLPLWYYGLYRPLCALCVGTYTSKRISYSWAMHDRVSNAVIDGLSSAAPWIVALLFFKYAFADLYVVPTESMWPTKPAASFIAVNKFAYGVRLPLSNEVLLRGGNVNAGDVVVVRYARDPNVHMLKRVAAVSGDHVVYRNHQLTVNGIVEPTELLGTRNNKRIYRATTNGQEHLIALSITEVEVPDVDLIVPEDSVFLIGDNRDDSYDSRYWGSVPYEALVGSPWLRPASRLEDVQ